MQDQVSIAASKKVPFLLGFAREIDGETYLRAMAASDELENTYDPETQTSTTGIYAGSQLTYERTMTDWSLSKDDTRCTDD